MLLHQSRVRSQRDRARFIGLSAEGGVRPSVYAGSRSVSDVVSPVHRAPSASDPRSRVNATDTPKPTVEQQSHVSPVPGVNAGPSTGFAGKGRERPSTTCRRSSTALAGRIGRSQAVRHQHEASYDYFDGIGVRVHRICSGHRPKVARERANHISARRAPTEGCSREMGRGCGRPGVVRLL